MARTKTKPGTKAMYETPEALEKACAAYFDSLKGTKDKPTVTGMCLFLGFTSREALAHYENKAVADDFMAPEIKEAFHFVVKRAKLRVEASYEQRLHDPACTGAIFALKNFGWHDRQDMVVSGGIEIKSVQRQIIHVPNTYDNSNRLADSDGGGIRTVTDAAS